MSPHRIDNAVINMYFVFCQLHDKLSILTTCITFYSGELILRAEEILFNILGEAIPKRRGDNKSKSDVNDMLEALKKSDDIKSDLPKFV